MLYKYVNFAKLLSLAPLLTLGICNPFLWRSLLWVYRFLAEVVLENTQLHG